MRCPDVVLWIRETAYRRRLKAHALMIACVLHNGSFGRWGTVPVRRNPSSDRRAVCRYCTGYLCVRGVDMKRTRQQKSRTTKVTR